MLQAGDLIIYSGEGVCRVVSVGTPAISGLSDGRLYYTLTPLYREGRIFIPVDSPVFMRPILTREAAIALIRRIPALPAASCSQRSPRLLAEHYHSLLQSHRCEDLVRLIKELRRREEEGRAAGRRPAQVDERYRKRAEDMLCGELAAALSIDREALPAFIAAILRDTP